MKEKYIICTPTKQKHALPETIFKDILFTTIKYEFTNLFPVSPKLFLIKKKTRSRFFSQNFEIHTEMLPSMSFTVPQKMLLTHFCSIFPFYTPLKTTENQRFPGVFRVYKTKTLTKNDLRLLTALHYI